MSNAGSTTPSGGNSREELLLNHPECSLRDGESTTQFAQRIRSFISQNASKNPDFQREEIIEKSRLYFISLVEKIESTAKPSYRARKHGKSSKNHLKDTSRNLFLEVLEGLRDLVERYSETIERPDFTESAMNLLNGYSFTTFKTREDFDTYFNTQEADDERWNDIKLGSCITTLQGFFSDEEDRKRYATRLLSLSAVRTIDWTDSLLDTFSRFVKTIGNHELKRALLLRFNSLPKIKNRKDRGKSGNEPWKTLFLDTDTINNTFRTSPLHGIIQRGDRPLGSK